MPKIIEVDIGLIDVNPYRNIGTYPILRPKVDALKSSIAVVGMWPSIIVRPHPTKKGRVEQAFGVSRLTAAKELGLKSLPLISMNLSEKELVQYMGRENGEDYGADVQISLNTWEAGSIYLRRANAPFKDRDVAELLGWVEQDGRMDLMARTCSAAFKLIGDGRMSRNDIAGIPASAAFNVVERVISRMELVDRSAKNTGTTPQQRERMKKQIAKGGKEVISKVRKGEIAARDVRHEVDTHAVDRSKGTPEELPMFRLFGKALTDQIDRMLRSDGAAEKLQHVVEALSQITQEADKSIVRQLGFDLKELELRAANWRSRLDLQKVVKLTTLEDRSA